MSLFISLSSITCGLVDTGTVSCVSGMNHNSRVGRHRIKTYKHSRSDWSFSPRGRIEQDSASDSPGVHLGRWLTIVAPLLSCFLRSELPHSPRSLTARLNDSDSRSVFLSWLRPFDGNSPLLYYVLELSENSKCGCVCAVCVSQHSLWSLSGKQLLTCCLPHSHLLEADIWRMVSLHKCTSRFLINKPLPSSLPHRRSLSTSSSSPSCSYPPPHPLPSLILPQML